MTSPVMRWTFVFAAVTAILSVLSVQLLQSAKKLMNKRKLLAPVSDINFGLTAGNCWIKKKNMNNMHTHMYIRKNKNIQAKLNC